MHVLRQRGDSVVSFILELQIRWMAGWIIFIVFCLWVFYFIFFAEKTNILIALHKKPIKVNIFSYFFTKTYTVGTH